MVVLSTSLASNISDLEELIDCSKTQAANIKICKDNMGHERRENKQIALSTASVEELFESRTDNLYLVSSRYSILSRVTLYKLMK